MINILIVFIYMFIHTPDCSNFKTGKFYTDTPTLGRTIIERNDSIQIEKNIEVGYHYVLQIEWEDDCTYKLTLIDNKSTNPKFSPPTPSFVITTRITQVNENSYSTEASLNGGAFNYGGVIYRFID
ncbi:hypothetical protein JKA74_15170 [Marivirga sp. S37H4]|uniref:Uncharacterized protein n=1 Tax=Marivirga aurantiaca TaxID=2802615 RepID=A0A934X023_9BACT|nr:hypothetical protein [Marivirga aurantiaca]MBK6266384.1 hypothetical protein [Marivirga aurantiaca]